MAKFLRRFAGQRLPAGIHPLLLLAVAVLAYGLVIPWLGFYWDDYPMAWIADQFGPEGMARYFSTNRPFWGLLYEITTPVIGAQPLAWQLFALFWRWASAAAFWLLLARCGGSIRRRLPGAACSSWYTRVLCSNLFHWFTAIISSF